MEIILYSTNCPRCKVLEAKMIEKDIPFKEVTDVEEMLQLGISQAPMVRAGNDLMEFSKAIEWIRKM